MYSTVFITYFCKYVIIYVKMPNNKIANVVNNYLILT